MAGRTLAYVRLPATLLPLLLTVSVVVSSELPSLTVAKFGSLQLSPSLVLKPGSKVVCERVEINGLSRLTNLTSFFSSVKLKVNSTGNIAVCFHRNASLGVGMCPESLWEKLTNGSWVRSMSPFDQKLLDIRSVGSSTVEVVLNEEFYVYRVIFLILGITMMTFASSLSNSLATYYGGAMTLGVLLVVLVILFQGMKILPSGRKSSLALVLYGSIVGVGSFLFSYVPTLLHALLVEMGINEDLYSPVAALAVVLIVVCGAWLGYWCVGKLVVTENGSIDTGVAEFVCWSIRIVGSTMILQCSVDPLLAVAALACGVLIPSAASKMLRRKHSKRRAVDSSKRRAVDVRKKKLSESDTFYSSFHETGDARKEYTKEEWERFTKESTKKALETLVWSPDFNRWAVANADRLALLPKKDTTTAKSWWS